MDVPVTADERIEALATFIDGLVAELQPMQRRYAEATWMANVTGEARYEQESARLDVQIRTLFAQPEPYAWLRRLADQGGVPDPALQRQLTLLVHQYRGQQIPPAMIERMVELEKKLESRFNNFRAELDGERVSDNQLREILRHDDDAARRERAWLASKQIGVEVVDDLLALVRLRNEAARSLGFDNFYVMSLELDEQNEAELFRVLDDLDRGTQPIFDAYKRALDAELAARFGVAPEALRPWHLADPFFQEAPVAQVGLDPYFAGQSLERLTERFFGAVGFEIADLLERADLYEKPGKSQHAFCLSVDRGADIRVLCNLRSNEYWMGTMLHEFGHAVYDKYIDRSLPYLLRQPAHILTTEASAMLFGRLSKNAAWLERYAGVPPEEARAKARELAGATRRQLLVQTRWCLVMSHMERALYRDPEQDLDTLWWDLVERFQQVRRPGRRAPDWASKIHFSVAPVYYHNYMLGEMMASQLQAHIQTSLLGNGAAVPSRYVSSPAVGAFLRERLYRSGRTTDWRGAIQGATGQPLGAAAFIGELAAAD